MIKPRAASNALPSTLGELELLVLEVLWKESDLDARTISERLLRNKSSLSTVQSTLERLYKKNLAGRNKQGHAYLYFPLVLRAQLLARLMSDVIHMLHDGRMETILSSFVNVAADLDEKSLHDLEQLIRQKRSELEIRESKKDNDT